jgi:hypothetical protein
MATNKKTTLILLMGFISFIGLMIVTLFLGTLIF